MEGLRLLAKGRNEMRSLLLKAGIALALSLAGHLFIQFRSRKLVRSARRRHPLYPPGLYDSVIWEFTGELKAGRKSTTGQPRELISENHGESSLKFSKEAKTLHDANASPIIITGVDDKVPEFNKLIDKESDFSVKELGVQASRVCTPERLQNEELVMMEQEIVNLNCQVKLLQERERIDFQLLECYEIREQETAVRELENSLKISAMEAKLMKLKIESLQADNRRLESQVSDHSRLIAELETARAKAKSLKKKLRSESEQANAMVVALHHRILALQENEGTNKKYEDDFQEKLTRLKEVEDEARDLRKANSRLILENVELGSKLEFCQIMAIDALENAQAHEVLDELSRLKQRNEELTKEIEQLQSDRCADVEELVYLRWINACLRYEMRNYQSPAGKTVARDLSKTSSPKSEEKAKQLILEYAEVKNDEKAVIEFESQYHPFVSSQTESRDVDLSLTVRKSSSNSSKSKLFKKLQRLVLGKGLQRINSSSSDRTTTFSNSERGESVSTCSFDDIFRRNSVDSISSSLNSEHESGDGSALLEAHRVQQSKMCLSESISIPSFGSQLFSPQSSEGSRLSRHTSGDEFYCSKRFILRQQSAESSTSTVQTGNDSADSPEKATLKKFARALISAQ